MFNTFFGISFSLEIPNVLSNPKYLKLVAITVAFCVSLPTPIATILIPIDLNDLTIERTAKGSEGSPSESVKKIFGFLEYKIGYILS